MLANPGDRDYKLINIPQFLIGGKYVGSKAGNANVAGRSWPGQKESGPWTWTIEVNNPTTLYIWIQDSHQAGITSQPIGWTLVDDDKPDRSDGGGQNGRLYSKEVDDVVELEATGLLVGGAFTEPCS